MNFLTKLLFISSITITLSAPFTGRDAGCDNYYTIFAMDASVDGSSHIDIQTNLIIAFSNAAKEQGLNSLITVSGVTGEAITNGGVGVPAGNNDVLLSQIVQAGQRKIDAEVVTFEHLIYNISSTDKVIINQETNPNAAVIVLLSSYTVNMKGTRTAAAYLEKNTTIPVLAVTLGDRYNLNATYMFAGQERIYNFDINRPTDFTEAINWILQSTCASSIPSTTPTPPVNSTECTNAERVCNIGIAVDGSSDALTPTIFNEQITALSDRIAKVISYMPHTAFFEYSATTNNGTGFEGMLSPAHFGSILRTYTQSPGSNITLAMEKLLILSTKRIDTAPFSSFLFVSSTTPEEVQSAIGLSAKLKAAGSFNIILLGDKIQIKDVGPLNPTSIMKPSMNNLDSDFLASHFKSSLKCSWEIDTCT